MHMDVEAMPMDVNGVAMDVMVWVASAMIIASVPMAGWALFGERPAGDLASRNLARHNPTARQAELQRLSLIHI